MGSKTVGVMSTEVSWRLLAGAHGNGLARLFAVSAQVSGPPARCSQLQKRRKRCGVTAMASQPKELRQRRAGSAKLV